MLELLKLELQLLVVNQTQVLCKSSQRSPLSHCSNSKVAAFKGNYSRISYPKGFTDNKFWIYRGQVRFHLELESFRKRVTERRTRHPGAPRMYQLHRDGRTPRHISQSSNFLCFRKLDRGDGGCVSQPSVTVTDPRDSPFQRRNSGIWLIGSGVLVCDRLALLLLGLWRAEHLGGESLVGEVLTSWQASSK